MKTEKYSKIVLSSAEETNSFEQMADHVKTTPIPDEEILANLGLYLTSKNLARILFFYEIYQKIINTHGVIMEFGVRWGQTLSIMSALRGILEPFNRHRRIVGFDTFKGFVGVSEQDGEKCQCEDGSFSVSDNYMETLNSILFHQEQLNPMSHIKRFELVDGDAIKTIPDYLKRHPETVVSLAIFDFDIYKPTKAALEAIKPHICRGSVLVFDELCDDIFPGETVAVNEVLGINNCRFQRMPMASRVSYMVVE